MSIRIKAVLMLTLLATLSGSAARAAEDDPAEKKIELKKGDRIIFFGDSLTALAIKDRNVPEGKGYVPLVREALKDRGVEVDAVATGGHRVPNLLARVDRDVLSKKPTIVVIQIGVNDAGGGVTPEMFKAQLEELIDRLQKGGTRVVLCSCTCRVEGYKPDNVMDRKLDALADVARTIAKEKKLPLNDLRKAFIDYWKKHNPDNKARGVLTYDGNHWTEEGHKYVAEQMLKKFK
jgi:lysophospholipase L1-like esterase